MKIIVDSDARRYACSADLYDFNELEHTLRLDTKLDFVNPVPVYSDSRRGKPIGYAHVYSTEDNVLKADIFIDYATSERLMIEIGESVYAIPDGDFSVTSRNEVDAIWVPHIMLASHPTPFAGIGGKAYTVAAIF